MRTTNHMINTVVYSYRMPKVSDADNVNVLTELRRSKQRHSGDKGFLTRLCTATTIARS